MKVLIRTLPALVFCALFHCCVFQPDENFIEIDQEPKASVGDTRLLKNLATLPDTFQIFSRSNFFTCAIEYENVSQSDVSVYLDEHRVSSSYLDSDTVVFGLEAADFSDGYHKIRVQTTTNSGTGSLADVAGVETVTFSREWTFLIKRFDAPAINITKIESFEGRLLIEFEPNPAMTDRQLDLQYKNGSTTINWSYLISDPTQTQVIDDRFIGGSLEASLTNLSIDPKWLSGVTSKKVQFNPIPGIVESTSDGHGNMIVKCNRSLFYNNVKTYRLSVNGKTLQTTSGRDTTLTVPNLFFPWNHIASVRTIAANLRGSSSLDTVKFRLPDDQHILVGEHVDHSFSISSWSATNPQKGFSANEGKGEVYVLDGLNIAQTFSIEDLDLFALTFSTSNDGETVFLANGTQIIKIDNHGNTSTVIDTGTLFGQPLQIGRLSVGDRYLTFSTVVSTQKANVYVYDLQEDELINNGIQVAYSFFAPISLRLRSDDKYLGVLEISNFIVYSIDNGTLVEKKRFPFSETPAEIFFDAARDNKMLLLKSNLLTIYDPDTDQSTVKNYSGPFKAGFMQSPTYDPVTGFIASVDAGSSSNDPIYCYVTNPVTGEVLRRIAIESNTRHIIYDGNLYHDDWKYDCKF